MVGIICRTTFGGILVHQSIKKRKITELRIRKASGALEEKDSFLKRPLKGSFLTQKKRGGTF